MAGHTDLHGRIHMILEAGTGCIALSIFRSGHCALRSISEWWIDQHSSFRSSSSSRQVRNFDSADAVDRFHTSALCRSAFSSWRRSVTWR